MDIAHLGPEWPSALWGGWVLGGKGHLPLSLPRLSWELCAVCEGQDGKGLFLPTILTPSLVLCGWHRSISSLSTSGLPSAVVLWSLVTLLVVTAALALTRLLAHSAAREPFRDGCCRGSVLRSPRSQPPWLAHAVRARVMAVFWGGADGGKGVQSRV